MSNAGRSVCSLCRSFLLRKQPRLADLPPRLRQWSQDVPKLGGSVFVQEQKSSGAISGQKEGPRELQKAEQLAELRRLPRIRFCGQTVIVSNPAEERDHVSQIRCLLQSPVLGFDTESHHHDGKRASLVQLASRDMCVLWRLPSPSMFPSLLHGILSSPRFLKVGRRGC